MGKNKISRLFYRFPFLALFYDFNIIKRVYKKFFVNHVYTSNYYIELTNRCNAECVFCPYVPLREGGKPLMSMSDDIFEKAIALIKTQKRPSILLTPTTGEIFMNIKWDHYIQRILDMDFVESSYFYTNGLLLNAQNREKFVHLKNLHKLSLSFSVGGIDRETYKYMYGKDKFDVVVENISEFLKALKDCSLEVPVVVDIKLPKNARFSRSLAKSVYNPHDYKYAMLKVRRTFDMMQGLITDTNLGEIKPIPLSEKKRPCRNLQDIRFAANGSIWLCGCAISELPGHYDLKVGDISQEKDLSNIMQRQKAIEEKWFYHQDIPHNCKECTWYVADRSR